MVAPATERRDRILGEVSRIRPLRGHALSYPHAPDAGRERCSLQWSKVAAQPVATFAANVDSTSLGGYVG